jgi:DNA-binding LacI/PurR family transcriptional regulator
MYNNTVMDKGKGAEKMGKTLADIAKEIGVSTATISRVLNGEDNVSAHTREKVLSALEKENYQKRTRRSSVEFRNGETVLIIAGQLQNPITLGFIDGIRSRLYEEGLRCMISLSDYDSAVECDILQYAAKNRFSGIFMLNAIENRNLIRHVTRMKTPIIFVNRYLRSVDMDVVTVDNYRCGYLATEYLIERGHRRIAHIAGPSSSVTCQNRTQGYLDAMRAHNLPVEDHYVFYGDRRYRCGRDFGEIICQMPANKRFSAVFSTTGLMAAGMVDVLLREGIQVPNDVSVICNDDYSRDYMPCPMDFTTFEQDPILTGKTAASLLLDRIAFPEQAAKRMVFPPTLTEHNSVISLHRAEKK